MKKIIAAVLLAACITSTFAGCGKSEGEGSVTVTNPPIQSTERNDSTAPESGALDTDTVSETTAEADHETAASPHFVVLDKTWKEFGSYAEGLLPALDVNGFWGYIDKTGEYIIEPSYYTAGEFSEGLAAVQTSSGYYGYIDKSGKEVISGNFTMAQSFHNGYAIVSEDPDATSGWTGWSVDSASVIDKTGAKVNDIEEKYIQYALKLDTAKQIYYYDSGMTSGCMIFSKDYKLLKKADGYTESQGGCQELYNLSTKYVISCDLDGRGYLVYDESGEIVAEQSMFENMNSIGISDDYIVSQRKVNNITTCALYDYSGNLLIDHKYKYMEPLYKNIILVKNNADVIGVIDEQGNEILSFSENITSSKTNMGYTTFSDMFCYSTDSGCFAISRKTEKTVPTLKINGSYLEFYRCDEGESGLFYIPRSTTCTVYDESGETVAVFYSGDEKFYYYNDSSESERVRAILADNIVPLITESKDAKLAVLDK